MYRLVPITLDEYRMLYDAGAWVYGDDRPREDWIVWRRSDTENDLLRDRDWSHCYTRIEQE